MDVGKVFIFAFYHFSILAASFSQSDPGDQCTDSRGIIGVCTSLNQCPALQEESKDDFLPLNCGFSAQVPLVCCPGKTETFAEASTAPPTIRIPGETATKWCLEYSKHCFEFRFIAGGTQTRPEEFPHMAAIGYGPRNSIQWQCGGSLISDKFVLTAAHCLHGGRSGPAEWVLLGTETLAPNSSSLRNRGQIHPVVRRIRHPGYKSSAKYDDVALLEFGPAISKNPQSTTSKELHPACLQTDDSFRYKTYIATGWGRVGHAEEPSPELLKVELEVFDEAKCNETFEVVIRTTNQLRRGIDSTMLCAGVLSGGKDTCQGDSGGPLQYSTRGSCMYDVWGITSFGSICAFADSPSVYTKVSAYIQWIEDNVWP